MRGDQLPATGEELVLAVGRSRCFATIAWSIRGQCGLTFDSKMSVEEVARIRNHATEQGGAEPEVVAALDDWMSGFAR